jgi:hypothetical protein
VNWSPLSRGVHLGERVVHRASRVVADLPRASLRAELAFRAERDAHRPSLPGQSVDDDLVSALFRDGIVVTDVRALGLTDVMTEAAPLTAELLDVPVEAGRSAVHLTPDRLVTAPGIFRWGAGERVLDLVERYLEVPPAYHGVYLRRDVAGAQSSASNMWHLDMEDRKVVKVLVYLTDVQDGDGSFQYLPMAQSMDLRRFLGRTYRLGADEEMRRLVPDSEWRVAGGPAGTVVISDTGILMHKGRRPQLRDRVTLFYDYTSRRPVHPFYCKSALPREHLEALTQGLGARAETSVLWRDRLVSFDPAKHE